MNREIKFRAWDKKEKKMWPVSSLHSNGAVHVDVPRQINPVMLNKDEFELMQDTGLKDKNGKEIYEGDILNYSKDKGINPKIVKYENGRFLVELNTKYNKKLCIGAPSYTKNHEVIGNIYENPELLNQ